MLSSLSVVLAYFHFIKEMSSKHLAPTQTNMPAQLPNTLSNTLTVAALSHSHVQAIWAAFCAHCYQQGIQLRYQTLLMFRDTIHV